MSISHDSQKVGTPKPLISAEAPALRNWSADLEIPPHIERGMPSILAYALRKATHAGSRIEAYNSEKVAFETALSSWPKEPADQLRSVLEATRFIDWAHMASDLMETFRSRGRLSVLERELHHLYNRCGSPSDPEFKNMRIVNAFLRETDQEPSLERLLQVHTFAMSGRVEGLSKQELGKVRDYSVVGTGPDNGFSLTEYKRILANPYLNFSEHSPKGGKEVDAKRRYGDILYPEPCTIREEALKRIEATHPKEYLAIQSFQEMPRAEQERWRDTNSQVYRLLTRSLLTALAEERYANFEQGRQTLGTLTTKEEVLAFIKLVAYHYRDMISLHVLPDGNGRTCRYESLYAPLDKVGISRPRLHDVDADILFSPSGWLTEVQRGILSTDALYRDITERIAQKLRIESSPELVFPNLVREVGITLKSRGRKATLKNAVLQKIDGAQFGAYVDTRFLLEPGLLRAFKKNPVESLRVFRDDYKEFAKRTLILGHIPKKGVEQLGLRLVDFDQRASFGVALSGTPDPWRHKINRWYENTFLYRGMCDTAESLSTEGALEIFGTLGWITLSNRAASAAGRGDRAVRAAVQKDFDRYNRDLVTGELRKMVSDHVGEGEEYDNSYGLSTSRQPSIAEGFAMGRGYLGYSEAEVKAGQERVKARVVVGAYQSKKDVDVRRFKMLDPQFSYKFGRQQEVMAVGGIDPDAVMIVYELSSSRKVIRSFVRNPELPSEIWEVTGAFKLGRDLLVGLKSDRVVARHRLTQKP